VTRHRGKSPRQAAFFFRNSEVTFHAAQLASLFLIYGLVGTASCALQSHDRVGSLESGILLCQTYEAYLELHTPVTISFEHAWFLLLALSRREEVGVTRCDECGGLRLRDLLARHKQDKTVAIAIRGRLDRCTVAFLSVAPQNHGSTA
jgi:hypothetical protein